VGMGCNRSTTILHGYFDNELDPIGAADFERHIEHCSQCAGALEDMEWMRLSIVNEAQLYRPAPAALRGKILASIGSKPRVAALFAFPRVRSLEVWQWMAVAAVLTLLVLGGFRLRSTYRGASGAGGGGGGGESGEEYALAPEILDAHLRSLQPGHLIDVVSTDRHTVKPWFDGKLNFSPPVQDFTEQGFPLQGGRVDVVHGRTVAALVYGRRKHFVNVFMWPASDGDRARAAAPHAGSRQGYQWLAWSSGGMEFCAVSDADASALQQLRSLLTAK
jgi:anti-sigma factor RsiW